MGDDGKSEDQKGERSSKANLGSEHRPPDTSNLDLKNAPPAQDTPKGRSHWGKTTGSGRERQFLRGHQGKLRELIDLFRIFFEFLRAFRTFYTIEPCVTVYGSARFQDDHPYYKLAREVGRALAREGFVVMTGGGPGVMEAANRGARDVGGHSVGCNIILPREQVPNAYLDRWMEFEWFFVRKATLAKYSKAFIALPGGFGTLDELFEVATMIQTRKMRNVPTILMGVDFWQPLLDFLKLQMVEGKTIEQRDLDRLIVTDDVSEAIDIVQKSHWIEQRQTRFPKRWKARKRVASLDGTSSSVKDAVFSNESVSDPLGGDR